MLAQNGRKRPQGSNILAPCLRRRTSVASPARVFRRRQSSTKRPELTELQTVVVNLERRHDRMEGCRQRLQKSCPQLPFQRFDATDGRQAEIPLEEVTTSWNTARNVEFQKQRAIRKGWNDLETYQASGGFRWPSMSMHTTQEWAQSAHHNMFQAQRSHRKAMSQQDQSSRAHEEAMSDNMGMYNELHSSLEQKVKTSQRLVDKLSHRAQSVEHSLQHTRSTLMKLQEALAAKDPPLALVMWRMEQREKRPLREQVRDTVEVCLEVEKASLMDAQRRLKEFIKKTQATITCLENKLEELRHDIQQKTQALSVDELCLRTTSRSLETA
eukprot:symbB.v1.2.001053.t1/scaffold33.1/size517934/5